MPSPASEARYDTLNGAVRAAVDLSADMGLLEIAIVREDVPSRGTRYWIEDAERLSGKFDAWIVCTLTAPEGPRAWWKPKTSVESQAHIDGENEDDAQAWDRAMREHNAET